MRPEPQRVGFSEDYSGHGQWQAKGRKGFGHMAQVTTPSRLHWKITIGGKKISQTSTLPYTYHPLPIVILVP